MIIYILTAGQYEEHSIHGVYSSYEKASEKIPPKYKEHSRGVFICNSDRYYAYYIEEWNLDE